MKKRLFVEKNSSQDKYFAIYSNTHDWDKLNYQVLLLWQIQNVNTKSTQELFFDKDLSKIEINTRVWDLVKHVEYECASKRQLQKNKKRQSNLMNAIEVSFNSSSELFSRKSSRFAQFSDSSSSSSDSSFNSSDSSSHSSASLSSNSSRFDQSFESLSNSSKNVDLNFSSFSTLSSH